MILSRASAKRRRSLWVEIGPAQTLSPYTSQPEAGKFPGSLLGSRAHRPKARQPLGGFSCGRPLGSGVLLLHGEFRVCRHRFYLLFSPARFKPGRPHHLAGTPYRFHKAHDGFLHAFSPSPGACGRPLRACTRRRPRKALRLCAFIFCNRYMRWRGRNEQAT